jgi:hypothetical protein
MMKMSNQEFTLGWYAYQAKINWVPGLPWTTGTNGLEVNHKLGRKIAAEMAVDGFMAPELIPNAANVAQAKGAGRNGN